MKRIAIVASLIVGLGISAQAVELISNGGFESGFTDWSDTVTGLGGLTTTPSAPPPSPAPPGGSQAATYENNSNAIDGGDGMFSVVQDFTVSPAAIGVVISFDWFFRTASEAYDATDQSFNIADDNEQMFVVRDILVDGASAFTAADDGSDVVMTLAMPTPASPPSSAAYANLKFPPAIKGLLVSNTP